MPTIIRQLLDKNHIEWLILQAMAYFYTKEQVDDLLNVIDGGNA